MNVPFLPVLHGRPPPTGSFHSDWTPEPTVVLGAFALAAAYLIWTGPLNRRRPGNEGRPVTGRQQIYFLSGCLALLLALAPPLDDWADFYLITAHMFQHMVLIFVVAPLLLAGTPWWVLEPLTRNRIANRIGYTLTRPAPALVISNVLILFWHFPGTYGAALRHEPIHILQHTVFLLAGLLAWWPVLGPLPAWPRLNPPLRCLYLFLYSLPAGLAGAFITMAAPGLYPYYDGVERVFNISLATDQQLAGLMMWVGGSTIYLLWITVIFLTWAGAEDRADREGLQPGAEHA